MILVSSIRGVVLFFKTFFFLVGSGSLMLLLLFDIAGWLGKRITLSVGGLVDGWVDGRMDGSLNFFFFFSIRLMNGGRWSRWLWIPLF